MSQPFKHLEDLKVSGTSTSDCYLLSSPSRIVSAASHTPEEHGTSSYSSSVKEEAEEDLLSSSTNTNRKEEEEGPSPSLSLQMPILLVESATATSFSPLVFCDIAQSWVTPEVRCCQQLSDLERYYDCEGARRSRAVLEAEKRRSQMFHTMERFAERRQMEELSKMTEKYKDAPLSPFEEVSVLPLRWS